MFRRSLSLTLAVLMSLTTTVLPLAGLGAFVITQTACPSSKSVSAGADRVAKEVDRALPLLRSLNIGAGTIATLEKVRDNALRVKEAFNSGDSSSTVARMEDLLDAFDAVVGEIEAVTDKRTQTVILLALYGVRRYVDSLADSLAAETAKLPASSKVAIMNGSDGAKIAAFRQRKAWSCRASGPLEKYKAGQYVPMAFCKKYPDNTQVVTR